MTAARGRGRGRALPDMCGRTGLALLLTLAGIAGCAALQPRTPAPSTSFAAPATPSFTPAATSPAAMVPLDVRIAGKIKCAMFPYGCSATVSVLDADASVADAWRPPVTDPVWAPDYRGTNADHFMPTPVGAMPILTPGVHKVVVSLLGSSDAVSFNPDGSVATDLLARCSAIIEVRAGSSPLKAVVTFAEGDPSTFAGTCSVKIGPA